MMLRRRLTPWLFLIPALVVYGTFVLVPVARVVVISLQEYKLDSPIAPHWDGFANYARLFHDPRAGGALEVSILYTLMIVPATVVLAACCAIALDRLGRKSRWFRPWILMPMVVAAPILAAVWFTMYEGNRGLLNWVLDDLGVHPLPHWLGATLALPSVAFAYTWGSIAFGTLLYTVALDRIDPQLYEAAAVDGAGPWHQIRAVTLPGMSRMTGVLTVLLTVNAMRDFQYPYVITGGGPAGATRTFTYGIYRTAFMDSPFDLGYASAMSLVFAAGLLILSVIVMRIARKAALE